MFKVFSVLSLGVLTVSCLISSNNPDRGEGNNDAFTIAPKGMWNALCVSDVVLFQKAENSAIKGYRKSIEFTDNSIKLITEYISDDCADPSTTVALRNIIEGNITYLNHRDMKERNLRLRDLKVAVTREYYQPKTPLGLDFIKAVRPVDSGARMGQDIEVEKNNFPFAQAEGVLAIHSKKRNNMHVFLNTGDSTAKMADKELSEQLNTANLYVKHVIK